MPRAISHDGSLTSAVPICAESACSNKVLARNRCTRHYREYMQLPECSVDACSARSVAHGYCHRHYQRLKNYGDPLFTKINVGKGNTPEARFWSKVAVTANPDRCWLWTASVINTGYGYFALGSRRWLAHRLAWLLVKGTEPSLDLLHSCDNPRCINPNHLREGTPAENARDRVERGRSLRGEACPSSKLTVEDVLVIRQQAATDVSVASLAKHFGVHRETIRSIRVRKTWQHVS